MPRLLAAAHGIDLSQHPRRNDLRLYAHRGFTLETLAILNQVG